MDTFNLIFMVVMIFGFVTIIVSLVYLNKEEKATPISSFDKSLTEVKNALNQADIAIDDLNFISEEMFKQFEEKKKELMFLYESIEKKKLTATQSKIDVSAPKFSYIEEEQKNKNDFEHPMLPKIKELLDQNYPLPEIARILNMGQGELKFIIELGMEQL